MIDKCVESGMVQVLQIAPNATYLFKSASLALPVCALRIVNEDFNQLRMGTENGIAHNRPVNIDTIKLLGASWCQLVLAGARLSSYHYYYTIFFACSNMLLISICTYYSLLPYGMRRFPQLRLRCGPRGMNTRPIKYEKNNTQSAFILSLGIRQ